MKARDYVFYIALLAAMFFFLWKVVYADTRMDANGDGIAHTHLDTIVDPITGVVYIDSLLAGQVRDFGGTYKVLPDSFKVGVNGDTTWIVIETLEDPPLECDPYLDHQFLNFKALLDQAHRRIAYTKNQYDTLAVYHGWTQVDSLRRLIWQLGVAPVERGTIDSLQGVIRQLEQDKVDLNTRLALTDSVGLLSLAAQVDSLIVIIQDQAARLDVQDTALTTTEGNCQAAWAEIEQHDELVEALTASMRIITAQRDSLRIEAAFNDSLMTDIGQQIYGLKTAMDSTRSIFSRFSGAVQALGQ